MAERQKRKEEELARQKAEREHQEQLRLQREAVIAAEERRRQHEYEYQILRSVYDGELQYIKRLWIEFNKPSTGRKNKSKFITEIVATMKPIYLNHSQYDGFVREYNQYVEAKEAHFLGILNDDMEIFMNRVKVAKTKSAKLNATEKALLQLDQAQKMEEFSYPEKLILFWKKTFDDLAHAIEMEDLTVKADKFEFKKDWKKALGAYQDLLYFLQHDDIPDEEQEAIIRNVEYKIWEMRKNLGLTEPDEVPPGWVRCERKNSDS